MKRYAIASLIVASMVGLALWWFSDMQVLKRRTEELLSTLTLDASSPKTSRQMGGYSLTALLASQVTLENPTLKEADGSFERSEMEAAYAWLCGQAKQTRFTSEKLRSITVNGDRARVELTLESLVELPTYRPVDGRFDAVLDWAKEDDGWRLTKASWTQSQN
jgi:hypothetical protein